MSVRLTGGQGVGSQVHCLLMPLPQPLPLRERPHVTSDQEQHHVGD